MYNSISTINPADVDRALQLIIDEEARIAERRRLRADSLSKYDDPYLMASEGRILFGRRVA